MEDQGELDAQSRVIVGYSFWLSLAAPPISVPDASVPIVKKQRRFVGGSIRKVR
ncbi:hypothetical protein D9M68_974790 [compost metagenome]